MLEYYLRIKKYEVLIYFMTGMEFENMLCERSQIHKAIYYMTLYKMFRIGKSL
jgi:hypothetical protein